jgi:hypothetical protein
MTRHRDHLAEASPTETFMPVGGDQVMLWLAAGVVRRLVNRVPVRPAVEEMRGRHRV